MAGIARYYDASKNPQGAHFPGVPLDDIDEERWESVPDGIKADVDASPYYRKTAPPKAAANKSEPAQGEEKEK
jgi:hypothetical protein